MSEHTKEPWEVKEMNNTPYVTCDGETLLLTHGWKGYHENMANAQRIVACVNACRETSNENLEDDCVIKMKIDRDQLLLQLETEKALADRLAKCLSDSYQKFVGGTFPVETEWPTDLITEWQERRSKE